MNRNKTGLLVMTAIIFAAVLAMLPARTAFAAGDVHFGSASYSPSANSDFNIGVYVESTDEVPLGDYSLTLVYDPNMVSYVGGGVAGEGATVVVPGVSADGKSAMHMLTFHALGNVGDTSVSVLTAAVNDTTGVPMEIVGLPVAPIAITQAVTRMPEYLRVNDKDVNGLTAGQTEYTFSVPYADKFEVEAPEGFTVTFEGPATPQVGRNNIAVVLTQPDAVPLELMLHVNMEEKEEEVVEPVSEESSETASEEASEDIGTEEEGSSEMSSEGISEVAPFEPVTPTSEEDGKTTLDGGLPPSNGLKFEFDTRALIFAGGCLLGAIILGVIIVFIMNGRSTKYEEEEDEDSDLEDWDEKELRERSARRAKRAAEAAEDAVEDAAEEITDIEPISVVPEKTVKKNTGMGDGIVAATYKDVSKKESRAEKEEAAKEARREKDAEKAAAREARREEKAAEEARKAEERREEKAAEEARKAEERKAEKAAEEARKEEERKEEEAKKQAKKEEARKAQAEAAEQKKAEAEKRKAEAEQKKAEERQRKEEEKKQRKAEEAQRKAEEEAQRKAEEEQRRAEEEQRKAEEEEQRRAEEEQRKAEEEEQRRAEEEQRKAEEEEQRRAEEEQRQAEEEQRRAEEEQRRAEEEQRRAETRKAKKKQRYVQEVDDTTGELSFLPLDYSEEDVIREEEEEYGEEEYEPFDDSAFKETVGQTVQDYDDVDSPEFGDPEEGSLKKLVHSEEIADFEGEADELSVEESLAAAVSEIREEDGLDINLESAILEETHKVTTSTTKIAPIEEPVSVAVSSASATAESSDAGNSDAGDSVMSGDANLEDYDEGSDFDMEIGDDDDDFIDLDDVADRKK